MNISREKIVQLSLELLGENKSRPIFFMASNQEIFLGWEKDNTLERNADSPTIVKKFFSSDSPKTSLWNGFTNEDEFTPRYYLYLNNENELSTNLTSISPTSIPFTPLPLLFLRDVEKNESKKKWNNYCEKIKQKIESNELEKLVPALQKTYKAQQKLSSTEIASLFKKILESPLPNTHLFYFKENDDVFLGASPELLFTIQNESLFIPAIAGTRPRGEDLLEDEKLAHELQNSKKEQDEHHFVVEFIVKTLKEQGLNPQYKPKPELLFLKTLQHLYTPIRAQIPPSIKAKKILNALHPTPAMAGVPQDKAIKFITEEESFERGLYASPMGFIFPNGNARFIVGIRSMLIKNNEIHLFAGAGFVKDSDPDEEWNEIERKIQTLESFLKK